MCRTLTCRTLIVSMWHRLCQCAIDQCAIDQCDIDVLHLINVPLDQRHINAAHWCAAHWLCQCDIDQCDIDQCAAHWRAAHWLCQCDIDCVNVRHIDQWACCNVPLRKRCSVFSQNKSPGKLTQNHMGCLQLVGSLKVQISFAKEPYERDYVLQKRPTLWRSLRIVATHLIYHLQDGEDS